MAKILVIAFDGLDKELIEKYNLEDVRQKEYGTIDNSTNMHSIKTSELFASFITGTNYEKHGLTGIQKGKYQNERKNKFIDALFPSLLTKNLRGFTALKDIAKEVLRMEKVIERYTKEDIQTDTLFNKIEGSRPMFIPGYNPGMIWRLKTEVEPLKKGYSADRNAEYWDKRSYDVRKKGLFNELKNDILPARGLLMCHFHRPDIYHHFYAHDEFHQETAQNGNTHEVLKKLYRETDSLAKEIKEKALNKGYDYVIFMSDHGLPTESAHNENAFYSCNKELFGDETPHITDFHDKILELTGNKDKIESN